METTDKLKNLLVMAAADGSLTDREIAFLTERCESWEVSDSEFAEAIQYAIAPGAELAIPETESERIAMLEDLVRMMAADGQLAETEKKLFATAAAQMQIDQAQLDRIIDGLIR